MDINALAAAIAQTVFVLSITLPITLFFSAWAFGIQDCLAKE